MTQKLSAYNWHHVSTLPTISSGSLQETICICCISPLNLYSPVTHLTVCSVPCTYIKHKEAVGKSWEMCSYSNLINKVLKCSKSPTSTTLSKAYLWWMYLSLLKYTLKTCVTCLICCFCNAEYSTPYTRSLTLTKNPVPKDRLWGWAIFSMTLKIPFDLHVRGLSCLLITECELKKKKRNACAISQLYTSRLVRAYKDTLGGYMEIPVTLFTVTLNPLW